MPKAFEHKIVIAKNKKSNWWYEETIHIYIPFTHTLLGPRGKRIMENHRNNMDITHTIDWGSLEGE
tara:strand:+ start:384 stop:581 length:198 start_codon:yes stop_codon:yes gene_type:complete